MFCYFNDGISWRRVDEFYEPQSGEQVYPSEQSGEQLALDFPGYTVALAEQDAANAITAALGAGCAIVSTATPVLNATYAIDDASVNQISKISNIVASRGRFPGGAPTLDYPDETGVPHTFSETNFTNFANAIEDYVYNVKLGNAVNQPVVIA